MPVLCPFFLGSGRANISVRDENPSNSPHLPIFLDSKLGSFVSNDESGGRCSEAGLSCVCWLTYISLISLMDSFLPIGPEFEIFSPVCFVPCF